MSFVTLEMGPMWRMQLLRGLLEARGLPAIVEDDSLSGFIGPGPTMSRLEVPEDVAETARTVIAESQRDGDQALAKLRFGAHERFQPPRPITSLMIDVGFWLALFLTAIWVCLRLL